MRANAARHADAHLREPIRREDVLASKPICAPLKLLDCCPISDGAAALVVCAAPRNGSRVALLGAGQGHRHQHLSAIQGTQNYGARDAAQRALAEARLGIGDMDYLAIYDSFTITLAILLEELGFAPRGASGARARRGDFALDGPLPLNTHGGLLAFGHSGVAGGMAHAVEAYRQLAGRAGERQAGTRTAATHNCCLPAATKLPLKSAPGMAENRTLWTYHTFFPASRVQMPESGKKLCAGGHRKPVATLQVVRRAALAQGHKLCRRRGAIFA